MVDTMHKQALFAALCLLLLGGSGCVAELDIDESGSLEEAELALDLVGDDEVQVAACAPPAATWQQYIEEQQRTTNGARAYTSYYYSTTYFCDSDPDTDYVFVFRLNYNCNPDSLRWWSDDTFTRWVLDDGLNAKSPTPTDDDVHLCIGDNSLRLIGGGSVSSGIWWILNYFYVFVP